MVELPFKVEWARPYPSARKAQHRLHPLISQTDAYGRAVRMGELLLVLPSCILIVLVLVQAVAGTNPPVAQRSFTMASNTKTTPAVLVSAAPVHGSPLITIEAERP